MKELLFVVCLAVYSSMAIAADRYKLIFPDGHSESTNTAPWDLTYPPYRVKAEVLKLGEHNEGTPMSSGEISARRTMHLIIIESDFAKESPEPQQSQRESGDNSRSDEQRARDVEIKDWLDASDRKEAAWLATCKPNGVCASSD